MTFFAFLALRTDASGRSFVYRATNIVVVETRRIPAFLKALERG